jgi:probable HAF family extracellular repeat protein
MSGGTFTTIDIPSSLSGEFIDREINTTARGLNTRGQIVGAYTDNRGAVRAFSFSQGTYIAIDPFGGDHSVAEGVNDDAQIVGYYNIPFENGFHGFIATPVAEQDTTPPVISGMPAGDCTLWPPNHKLVQVATVTATDAESGIAPDSFTVNGSSNEPFDTMDIVITPDGSGGFVVQLRTERLGQGNDRIYTLTATAADLAGNWAMTTATCVVPHDQHGRNQSSTSH